MRKNTIICELMEKGYSPEADLDISGGDTVYKYTLRSGQVERLYMPEGSKPFWGMSRTVLNRLCQTTDSFYAVFLSTKGDQSFVVDGNSLRQMQSRSDKCGVSVDKNGNYRLRARDMHKLNAIPVIDYHLFEFFKEQW